MRKHLIILLYSVLLFSCEKGKEKNMNALSRKDSSQASLRKDSSAMTNAPATFSKEHEYEDTLISKDVPKITSLPFWAHYSYYDISRLVKKSSIVYKLPPIEKLNYIHTDSSRHTVCHNSGMPVESIFNFRTYRYKLPDIYGYKSYLICDTTFEVYKLKYYQCYQFMYGGIHGYLILYDSLKKEAKVIALYYIDPSTRRRRTFDIDEKYRIHLNDYSIDEETGEEYPTFKYTITILSDGEVSVKKKPANPNINLK